MQVSRILLCSTLCSTIVVVTAALAVETKTWVHSEVQEFDKGTLKGVSLANSGRISLAPKLAERLDAGASHLWSAVAASGGHVYAGSSDGKVYVLDAAGKSRLLATLDGGGTVYALAAQGEEIYAATSPDAKIWRIGQDGKAVLFATAKVHYIWALIPAGQGAFYAATGDPGQILQIDAKGNATVLFDAGETHVRSLAVASDGNLIAGTDSSGMVLRVNAKGEGFVLQQTGKREVTAIAVAKDGTIYAAASGNRTAAPLPAPTSPAPAIPPTPASTAPGPASPHQPAGQTTAPRVAGAPPTTQPYTAAAGGSEIWRIGPDGEPVLYWNHSQALVYSLAFDAEGRLLAATGNQGRVYRIESPQSYTRLVQTDTGQATALAPLPGGGVVVATANPGKLFQLGPHLESSGSLESAVFDAGSFTRWGRLRVETEAGGGAVKIETRSGNLDTPEKNWSPWVAIDPSAGSRVASPPAHFLQWRATFTAQDNYSGPPPVLKLVEVAYQQKNVAPILEKVEITPFNHKFPGSSASALSGSSANTLSLPPIGQVRRGSPSVPSSEPSGAATMNYDKGWIGARWKASDLNGDALEYKVEYRGEQEHEWKLLKEHVKENRISWDATSFADGRYLLRVTATDLPDNYPEVALSASLEGERFIIDNTPPRIEALSAKSEGGKLVIRFHAVDALSDLDSAEYSINGADWKPARPVNGMTDAAALDYLVEAPLPAGSEWTVAVRVTDENDNVEVSKIVIRP
jgi:outer membrane protein assembly factor BamB